MKAKLGIVAKASVCFVSSFVLLILLTMPAQGDSLLTVSVSVPGTSNPWLADGSSTSPSTPDPPDVAPLQSPVFASSVAPGSLWIWSVTEGGVSNYKPPDPADIAGPNGDAGGITSHLVGAENGISDIKAPINSLLGVFLSGSQPDSIAAPGALDFSSLASRNYGKLYPALQQVFFMGDGSGKTVQAPEGATRLYLGTMDAYGWADNYGSFNVTLIDEPDITTPQVPEPSTMLLLGSGLIGLWGFRRKFKS